MGLASFCIYSKIMLATLLENFNYLVQRLCLEKDTCDLNFTPVRVYLLLI